MVLIADPNTAYLDPFRRAEDARHALLRGRPGHRRALLAATRATSPRRRRSTSSPPAWPTPPTSVPSPSSSSSTTCASRRRRTALLPGRLGRGAVEHRHRRGPEPRLQAAHQGGLLPGPADGPLPWTCAPTWRRRSTQVGIADRAAPPRGGLRRPGRDRHPLRHAAGDGRQADDVQVRPQERGLGRPARASRSCRSRSSRTTARACTRTSRCGRAASRCSTTRPATPGCPTWPAGTSAACSTTPTRCIAFTNPTTNSFKRLVPGYEAPVNLVYSPAQPLGVVPHPARPALTEGQAGRVPLPRLHVEPVPRLLGDDARRPRRHRQPHRAARRRWTRTSTTSRPRSSPTSRRSPARSRQALDALEADSDFLRAGGVFTDDLIETWITYKRSHEVDALRLRPHPYEFTLYYDI